MDVQSAGQPGMRSATASDARQLSALVRRAKAHWGYPKEWLAAWRAELTVTADYIRLHRVVVMQQAGKIAGFYGLELRADVAHLEHLWVEPAYIGRGMGRMLLDQACSEARELGYASIELVADPHAEPFYLHQGAVRIGEIRSAVLGCPRLLPKMRLGTKGYRSMRTTRAPSRVER